MGYTECSCVYSDIEYRHNDFDRSGAAVGRCHQPCHSIYVFLLIFAVAVFAGCCAQSPVLVITLGTVDEKMKSFALGLQYFLQRGMAYIPTPIYFGYIIDSTCLIWQWNCDRDVAGIGHDTRGLCLEYDRKRLPPTMFGSSLAVKTLGLVFLVTCALRVRESKDEVEKDTLSDVGRANSGNTPKPETPLSKAAAKTDTTPFAVDVTPMSVGVDGDASPMSSAASRRSGLSSAEKLKQKFGRTSRRALFRHRKLDDVNSGDEIEVEAAETPLSQRQLTFTVTTEDEVSKSKTRLSGTSSSSTPPRGTSTTPPQKACDTRTATPPTPRSDTPTRTPPRAKESLSTVPRTLSAKKGNSSVHYNRMRNDSDVIIRQDENIDV